MLNNPDVGVLSRALRSVLTADEYERYCSEVSAPTSLLEVISLDGKPDVIVHYAELIVAADRFNSRADAASRSSTRYNKAVKLRQQAEHQYERACEYLDEQLGAVDAQTENAIRAWLDRDFNTSPTGNISIDCVGVARVVGSRNKYCLAAAGSNKQDKLQRKLSCQQQALTVAACALLYEPALESEILAANHTQATDRSEKLRAMLALPDDDLY
ncbi:MAG: hypothetical protein Q7U05_13630 [Polaromonas sp.]|nr:hypothetical protein [Polaromonas sp.]